MTINASHTCFCWFAHRPLASGADRAALLKATKWSPGDIITARFMDGDPAVQERVRKAARGWCKPGLANLKLDFTNDPDASVRISFEHSGSWSVLGTTCKRIAKSEPTMNYGWLEPGSTDTAVESVVLHEFGHALGLIHEHQNPAGGIKWNKEKVYETLSGPPNRWSREVVDHNLFEPYDRKETNYTAVDPDSIMMYPIPAAWTTDGFSVGLNTKLSATDKTFIHAEYP
jgi:hypothetical protein